MTRERTHAARAQHPGARAGGAVALVLACLLAACGAPSRPSDRGQAGAGGGSRAEVEFADLDRIHAFLAGLRGRPVFINFWATWCVPCVEELPDLAALSREDATKGARFVGVSLDAWITGNGAETEEKVRDALAGAGVGYPNLIYRGDQDPLLEGFQLPGPIPYSVLYDGRGKPAASWTGRATIEEIRRAVAATLERGAAAPSPKPPGGR